MHNPWTEEDSWPGRDSDGDGLTDQEEFFLGTDSYRADTDGDGLTDSQELALGSNPHLPDSDWDGIRDAVDWWNGPQPEPIPPPPTAQEVSESERWNPGVDANLPPFLQAKQTAQAALKADLSESEVQRILRESPQFRELEANLGTERAERFAALAIAATQQQQAIESFPRPSQEIGHQPEHQRRIR